MNPLTLRMLNPTRIRLQNVSLMLHGSVLSVATPEDLEGDCKVWVYPEERSVRFQVSLAHW